MLINKTNLQKNKTTTCANMQPHHPKLDDKLLIFHANQPSEIEKKVIVANTVVGKISKYEHKLKFEQIWAGVGREATRLREWDGALGFPKFECRVVINTVVERTSKYKHKLKFELG